VAELVESYIY